MSLNFPIQAINEESTALTPECEAFMQQVRWIDENNLMEEFQNTPVLLGWWGGIVAHFEANMERAKYQIKVMLGQMDDHIRSNLIAEGAKVTEKIVESATQRSDSFRDSHERYIAANKLYKEGLATMEELRSRQAMVVSISFQKKFEAEMLLKHSGFSQPPMPPQTM